MAQDCRGESGTGFQPVNQVAPAGDVAALRPGQARERVAEMFRLKVGFFAGGGDSLTKWLGVLSTDVKDSRNRENFLLTFAS